MIDNVNIDENIKKINWHFLLFKVIALNLVRKLMFEIRESNQSVNGKNAIEV